MSESAIDLPLPANPDAAAPDEIRQRDIAFAAADGFALGGTLFEGGGDRPLVLISSATAVPRGYYAAFARALCKAGARAVLTYDYRGLPGSPAPRGWGKRIGMKDWAVLDMPAAAATLDAIAPGHAMTGVGQSYGGQALGLCRIAGRFTRYGMVATMSGYHRGLDDRWAGPRMFLIGVPVASLLGRVPRWLGIGEPIPASVFRDWARWCRRPDYFFGDPAVPETAGFAEVTTPILALGLTDDRWGTRRATRSLLRRYAGAPVEERWLSPADGGAPIGHLGFFRSRFSATLWPQFIAWLLEGTAMTAGTRTE